MPPALSTWMSPKRLTFNGQKGNLLPTQVSSILVNDVMMSCVLCDWFQVPERDPVPSPHSC